MKTALPLFGLAAVLAYLMVRDAQAKAVINAANAANNYTGSGRFVPVYTGTDIAGGPAYG